MTAARIRVGGLAAAILIGAFHAYAGAQVPDTTRRPTRVIGVFDAVTGAPIADVRVRDAFTGTYALTTATGTARLDFLTYKGDAAVVQLVKLGYEPRQVIVSRGDTTGLTELMDPMATLPTVVTTAKYRIDRDAGRFAAFEQRCQSGSPTCIRTDDLEKHPSANIADFLLRAPGVTLGSCSRDSGRGQQCGRIAMKPTVSPPAYCTPTFFVDGFEWKMAPVDLTPDQPAEGIFMPTNVKAIEIYPSSRNRPLRFTGDPLCGAVVIWTK